MNKTEKFELIYERYANEVYRLSLYLLKDETKAKDITQQAFENIYKRLQEGDEESVCNQLLIEAKRLAKNQDTKEVRK